MSIFGLLIRLHLTRNPFLKKSQHFKSSTRSQWRRTQPHLSSIFINHVAAAMHRYWAAAYPDDYESNNMPMSWRYTYKDEIDEAMKIADNMLARIFKTIDTNNTTLLILGSMGQAAVEHEPTFNQLIINDMRSFMKMVGMCSGDYEQRRSPVDIKKCRITEPELLPEFF